jgi:hypothetical protein
MASDDGVFVRDFYNIDLIEILKLSHHLARYGFYLKKICSDDDEGYDNIIRFPSQEMTCEEASTFLVSELRKRERGSMMYGCDYHYSQWTWHMPKDWQFSAHKNHRDLLDGDGVCRFLHSESKQFAILSHEFRPDNSWFQLFKKTGYVHVDKPFVYKRHKQVRELKDDLDGYHGKKNWDFLLYASEKTKDYNGYEVHRLYHMTEDVIARCEEINKNRLYL